MVLATQVCHFGWLNRDQLQTLNLLLIYKGMMKVYKFNKLISKLNFCLMYMTAILLLIIGHTVSKTCPESTPCTYREQYSI